MLTIILLMADVIPGWCSYSKDEYLQYFNQQMTRYSPYLEVAYTPEQGFHAIARVAPIPADVELAKIPSKYVISSCKCEPYFICL